MSKKKKNKNLQIIQESYNEVIDKCMEHFNITKEHLIYSLDLQFGGVPLDSLFIKSNIDVLAKIKKYKYHFDNNLFYYIQNKEIVLI